MVVDRSENYDPYRLDLYQGGLMRTALKAASTMSKVMVAGTLLIAGYALFTSLPDLRRYIRISTM
jgi:hypothetical protein